MSDDTGKHPLSTRLRPIIDVALWVIDEIKALENRVTYWCDAHTRLYREFMQATDERDQARRHAETAHKNLQVEREKNEELNKRVAQWVQAWQSVDQARRDLNRAMINEPTPNSYVPEYVFKINAGFTPKPRLCPHGTVWLIGGQTCQCDAVYAKAQVPTCGDCGTKHFGSCKTEYLKP